MNAQSSFFKVVLVQPEASVRPLVFRQGLEGFFDMATFGIDYVGFRTPS